jgi:DNA polymerase (family 10)
MNNQEVAELFATIADMLEIKGDNPHRIRAYRRAAENISTLSQDINAIWREGGLTDIPGIGKGMAASIDELLSSGKLAFYEELVEEVPPGVVEMLTIPDVGPKTAARLWKDLGLTRIEDVERAADSGKIRELSGMGAKTEARILAGIEALRRRTGRALLGIAWPAAHIMLEELAALPGVEDASVAGSLRRMRDTIGDIDLLIAAPPDRAQDLMAHFRKMSQVQDVLVSGATKTSVRTHEGLQVDLRILEPARWGTALQYFTGSKPHNVRLREIALRQGLSLSENSLKRKDGSEMIAGSLTGRSRI